MSGPAFLVVLAVAIPLVASVRVWLGSTNIAERHHSHHDTYVIASTLTWTLVFAMIFMGALGILLGWLCIVGVFGADATTVLAFFDAFLVVSFVYWAIIRRYKVVTYDERMEITPFVGRRAVVVYRDIEAMEWRPSLLMPSSRNIVVLVRDGRQALLWCGLDLDQILVRIGRFDAFDSLGRKR